MLAQWRKTVRLCTYCGDVVQVVDKGGKDRLIENPAKFCCRDRVLSTLFLPLSFLPHRVGGAGILICRLSNHLKKCPDLRSERAMARMDHIQAAAQGFRIEKFDRGELMGAKFLANRHLGQK